MLPFARMNALETARQWLPVFAFAGRPITEQLVSPGATRAHRSKARLTAIGSAPRCGSWRAS